MLDVTVLGHATRPVRRRGGRVGDELWVTGRLGGAGVAVADLSAGLEPTPGARTAFERPRPRVLEALWLSERGVLGAAIDVSDGLARDAGHLAYASGVAVRLDFEALPVAAAVRPYLAAPAGRRLVLSGGEDYELLFAARPGSVAPLRREFEANFDLELTLVGGVEEGEGVTVREEDGSVSPAGHGFDHFGRPPA